MSLNGRVDVVVIGFGVAGAAAALAAAAADARVLVLDQGVPAERRLLASRAARSRDALRTGLRAAALAAGVEVRAQFRVHELVVDAGQVSGVGYATLPPRGIAAAGHRWLQRAGDRAPAGIAPVLTRAADAVWQSVLVVGEVGCSSVVLALDPRHWEFVGPAMWTAARTGLGGGVPAAPAWPRPLRAVPATETGAGPTPELAVRTWCAARETPAFTAAGQTELRVDETTGAVLVGDDQPVPGLYSAVQPHRAGADSEPGAVLAAGKRAGLGALAMARHARVALRSVG
ncbi:hypothetical protein DPM19_02190 [Actinomadura craniellae]|uniref:FAD-binding protein n=1 Tax=Actinomadura craniellae TaxID=2231787 RepID=A0A365HDK2_9ACTN|nr:hypothetical protein [Actinomadura craniellae]RAY16996.1 hypothetical protein DPM19_02190 [Actinomadura craniellae]